MSETIGFIGLGNMGLPMCLNLVEAGFDVVAFDLRPEPVEEWLASEGGAQSTPPRWPPKPTSYSPRSPAPTMLSA